MKARANLSLSRLSVPEKIEKAKSYVSRMTDNPSFTSPFPPLAEVTLAINALEAAYNEAQGAGPMQTAIMREKETALDDVLSQLANYVESVAKGSEAIILSAGMQLKGKGSRSHPGFSAEDGEHTGEVVLHTKSVRNAAFSYQVIKDSLPATSDAERAWEHLGVSIRASFIARNLNAGVKYWFRVAVVDKSGQGPWSDPISKIVNA